MDKRIKIAYIQLGRRNLSPIQRIAIAEKYRSIYEKQAKENMSLGGGDKKSPLPNLVNPIENKIDTTKKLAQVAGVGKETYRMGADEKCLISPIGRKYKRN